MSHSITRVNILSGGLGLLMTVAMLRWVPALSIAFSLYSIKCGIVKLFKDIGELTLIFCIGVIAAVLAPLMYTRAGFWIVFFLSWFASGILAKEWVERIQVKLAARRTV